MVDYEETRENAILSLEQQIKQLVKDAFDKGYQCGYKDRKDEPQTDCLTCRYNSDEWDSPKCDGCSKADSHYEPQTDCAWSKCDD